MGTFKRRILGFSSVFSLLVMLMLTTSMSAFADGGGGVSPSVTAGSLTETDTISISSLTLSGLNQSLTITLPITVTDARGSGVGWHMTISASAFSDGGSHSLAAPQITGGSAACHSGSTCTLPSATISALSIGTSAASFYSAATNNGMGEVDLTPTITVSLPSGTTYAGTYSSTVTVAVVSTP